VATVCLYGRLGWKRFTFVCIVGFCIALSFSSCNFQLTSSNRRAGDPLTCGVYSVAPTLHG
jgi:hypothetical protein